MAGGTRLMEVYGGAGGTRLMEVYGGWSNKANRGIWWLEEQG